MRGRMHKYLKVILALLVYMMFMYNLKAQTFQESFEQFKNDNEVNFDQFVEQKDEEFAHFLKENWRSFRIYEAHEKNIRIKPRESQILRNPESAPSHSIKVDSSKRVRIIDELIMPSNHKRDSYRGVMKKTPKFPFYGDSISIIYDSKISSFGIQDVTPDKISVFWKGMGRANYRATLDNLHVYKSKYSLNDFGYYLLVRDFCESFLNSSNAVILVTWFILSKSSYKCKIGYNSKSAFIALPSKQKVYGKKYFNYDGQDYYIMDFSGGDLLVYDGKYPNAFKTMDFSIREKLSLKEANVERVMSAWFENENHIFKLVYNRNAIDFYNAIPSIDLEGYFGATTTQVAQASLIQNLEPFISKMDELEAVSFLLNFVQSAFPYQIDEEQFGKEKVFFPEEMLHYPFSDCEDRSVFFAYLVNMLLGNSVIGLDYPNHISAAVHFSQELSGDYVFYDEKKYIVCDPTYLGAPVGMSMLGLDNYTAKIILSSRSGLTPPALDNLKKTLGIEGELEAPNYLKLNRGHVMVANQSQSIFLNQKEIEVSKKSVIMAGVDDRNQLDWFKSIDANEPIQIESTKVNHEGNILLLTRGIASGFYELLKINHKGVEVWRVTLPLDKALQEGGMNRQVFIFDQDGNHLAGQFYRDLDFEVNTEVFFRKNKIFVVVPLMKNISK